MPEINISDHSTLLTYDFEKLRPFIVPVLLSNRMMKVIKTARIAGCLLDHTNQEADSQIHDHHTVREE